QLMARLAPIRAGAILAVSDFEASLAFYRDRLGIEVEATYGDPPYATLVAAGARISLAEQGHPAEDRPGVDMAAVADPTRADVVLVLEVADARRTRRWPPKASAFSRSRTSRRGEAAASSASTRMDSDQD